MKKSVGSKGATEAEPGQNSDQQKPGPIYEFVPSTEWQDVPEWVADLPNFGVYRTTFDNSTRQARWDDPPGPETIIDKRTGKPQTPVTLPADQANANGADPPPAPSLATSTNQPEPAAATPDPGQARKSGGGFRTYEENMAFAARHGANQTRRFTMPEAQADQDSADIQDEFESLIRTRDLLEKMAESTDDPAIKFRCLADARVQQRAIAEQLAYQAKNRAKPWAQMSEEEQDRAEPDWQREVEEISLDSLLAFDRANDPDSRIGNRWLCRGDTVVIQGETGIGKSTLVMQGIICWAIGEPLFGIKGKDTLKSLLIESENNQGDLAEVFQDVIKAMGLRSDQIDYLKTKIVIVRESAKTGHDFLKLVRRLIKKHKPDLVFADPLLSYAGDDVSQQKAMSAFLRNGLHPIVQKSGVIWFWVHHFSKPPRDDRPGTRRSVYSGIGSVEIAGWARETITVNVVNDEERLCEIEFGKRARRVGLSDEAGNPIYKIYIQQSKTGVLWDLADQAQVKKAVGAAAKYGKAAREIRQFIERKVNVTHPQMMAFAKQIDIGGKNAVNIARAIIDDQSEPRIYEYRLKGRTYGSSAFSVIPLADNPLAFVPKKRGRKRAKK